MERSDEIEYNIIIARNFGSGISYARKSAGVVFDHAVDFHRSHRINVVGYRDHLCGLAVTDYEALGHAAFAAEIRGVDFVIQVVGLDLYHGIAGNRFYTEGYRSDTVVAGGVIKGYFLAVDFESEDAASARDRVGEEYVGIQHRAVHPDSRNIMTFGGFHVVDTGIGTLLERSFRGTAYRGETGIVG